MNTSEQYDEAVKGCKDIFIKKTKDYGTSWRVYRTISIVDQIFIKVQRIRNLQMGQKQMVQDDIPSEFVAIVNYGIMGLIQLELNNPIVENLDPEKASELYDKHLLEVKNTMLAKNNDYGEAWRDMSQESFADLILVKILRIKQILANDGTTLISEGIDSNYTDIINYAVFALIKNKEHEKGKSL
ncbi:MAG: hypothetical protein DI598_11595 [Pseudopedobacter saltans]|uniref:Nucleotide modification associated domain-containing protein n=1 Tax=Pseudopedobacter saltans TaxID=151895 RepID=A0A2W5GMF6_9SPHI|nr:MAG: hypothetical protein DI598_11595 [Pseudopedobacter saltans]